MKRSFDFTLEGRKFFPLFIGYWIPFLIIEAILTSQNARMQGAGAGFAEVAPSLLASLGLFLLSVLFQIPFMRRLVPAVTFDGTPFGFQGSIGRYFGINLLGLFLSVITAGIYFPWFIARITRYLAGETSYKGSPLRFEGKGGRLFVIVLLTLLIPVIAVTVVVALAGMRWGDLSNAFYSPTRVLLLILAALILLAFLSAYLYGVYRWVFTNLRYEGRAVRWTTEFWGATAYIWFQLLLSLITIGIYAPAAYIRLYRYFVNRTIVDKEQQPFGGLAFEGAVGKGFGLLWGQGLLCLITAGIYIPWAAARVGRWYLSNTSFQEEAAA
jgi:uncharacterized membrane protein YjgN (DUF898 family)